MKLTTLVLSVIFLFSSLILFSQNRFNQFDGYEKRRFQFFNVKVKAGYFNSSVDVKFDSGSLRDDLQSVTFDKVSNFRFGIELEHMFPYSNRWSFILEPSYQRYEDSQQVDRVDVDPEPFTQTVNIDYSFLEFPLGVRHHIYLKRSKIFLNATINFVVPLNDTIDYSGEFKDINLYRDLEIDSGVTIGLGFGYSFDERYSLEYRYNVPTNILNKSASYQAPFKNSGLILGFRF